jgi:opacity protein-like surface antigen
MVEKFFYCAAAALGISALFAFSAQAQTNWNGFYVGINGGGNWGNLNTTASDIGPDSFFAGANVPAVAAGASQRITTSGALAGGQIGYLYQAGPAIVGVDAGFDWSGLSGSTHDGPTTYPVTPPSTFSWNLKAKQDWLFTFLGRAGVNMGTWYPYVTAGVAVTHEKYTANYVDTFYPSTSTNTFSRVVAGPALGAGAEIQLMDHWLLRAEYLYTQFDGVGGNGPIACTPGVGACVGAGFKTTFAFKTSTFVNNVVRVAASYKF